MKWATPAMQRHDALASYLSELGLVYGEERASAVPSCLTHDGSSIELDPWEQTILESSLRASADVEVPPWAPLLAEGLAFQMKCLGRTRDDETAMVHEIEDELEQLVTDTAVGLALMEETQRAIDRLVVSGEMNGAKKLTAFRHKVCQAVGVLKETIGTDEYERAENKSEGMLAPTQQMVSSSSGPVPAGAWVAGRKPKRSHKKGRMLGVGGVANGQPAEYVPHTRRLAVVFLSVLCVWMYFFMPRMFEPQAVVLQRSNLSGIPGVMRVEAYPPSLFVTINSIDWGRMSSAEKLEVVEQVGTVAAESGYVGADIRGDDGIVFGRWFETRGAELVASVRR